MAASVIGSNPGTADRGLHAPGAGVVIRDEEWVIRRVNPSSDGWELLACDGVSGLVRDRTADFLTALEGRIDVLDSAETKLKIDMWPHFTAGFLHIEARLRRNIPNDDRVRLGDRAVMDLVPYQARSGAVGAEATPSTWKTVVLSRGPESEPRPEELETTRILEAQAQAS